jgi:AbrB family looped-hinge helix DNA binding protein
MTTRLSTKGQLIIPRAIRSKQGWSAGTLIVIEDRGDSVVLRAVAEPAKVDLDDVIGSAGYTGRRRSLPEMAAAIAKGAGRR